MRDKFLMIGLFFLLMAAIPLCFLLQNGGTSPEKQDKRQNDDEEALIAQTAALCGSAFCDETIRAAAIIQKTNAAAGIAVDRAAENNSDPELYSRVTAAFHSVSEILTCSEEAVYIPVEKCSNGCTDSSAEYAYLKGAASPWDCFSADYRSDQSCVGVSMNGIDYLCREGLSAEEALHCYLPKLSFRQTD